MKKKKKKKKKKRENLKDKVSLESYLFLFFWGQCQIANLDIKLRLKKNVEVTYMTQITFH